MCVRAKGVSSWKHVKIEVSLTFELGMKNYIVWISVIIVIVLSFFAGMHFSKIGIARSVGQLQAELSFGHLKHYKDLQVDLRSNCKPRAESRLVFMINEQKMLMAEYVQKNRDEQFEKYINMRDKNLMTELRTYKVDWDKEWTLPVCK